MAIEKKMICPLMQGPCIEDGAVVNGELHACRFWVKIQGKHPQTGVQLDHANCSFAWTPILMVENSQVNRETGAAIESFRNEMTASNQQVSKMFAGILTRQSLSGSQPSNPSLSGSQPLTLLSDTNNPDNNPDNQS